MNSMILSFVIFMNPFLFGRVIWGSDIITIAIICIGFLFLLKNYSSATIYWSKPKLILFVIISSYFISTSIVRLWLGQKYGDLSLHFYQYLSLVVVLSFRMEQKTIEMIYRALLFALIWHVWTIIPQLPFNSFLSSRLSALTAYSTGEYSIGGLTRRATGFFTSPGYLSLFASSSFAIGVFVGMQKINKLSVAIVTLSCIAGFGAFSRTFMVVFFIIIMYVVIMSKLKYKLGFVFLFVALGAYFTTTVLFKDYYDFVGQRLNNATELSSNDRISGETGVLMAVKSIKENPLFGSGVAPDGGDIKAQVNNKLIRPHLGVLAIIAFYGCIISSLLIVPYFIAFYYSFIGLISKNDLKLIPTPFYAGFMASFLVCIAEPLVDTNIPLFFMVFSILLTFGIPRYRSDKYDSCH